MQSSSLALALFALIPSLAHADLRLPALFSDGAVLQRESVVPLWGWAEPGQQVRVRASWSEDELTARADGQGRWRVELATPAAGGPYRIEVAGSQDLVLEDLWIGEVWLCSGQSNMEWPIAPRSSGGRGVRDWEAEVAAARYPRLRVFDVERATSMEPVQDCAGRWIPCSPETAGGFSAVAYFFGRELHRQLGVPVGLVTSSWGGTRIEAWTSEATLEGFAELEPELEGLRAARRDPEAAARTRAELRAQWWRHLEESDAGFAQGWASPGFRATGWGTTELPSEYAQLGLGGFDGCVWYRREIELPAELADRELVLELCAIDDMDLCWLDGVPIGETRVEGRWNSPRAYPIPAARATAGRHLLAICAVDTGGLGGPNGDAAQLVLRRADGQGPRLSLAGEWRWQPGAELAELGPWPRAPAFHHNSPSALYNGMIAPLAPYGLRGAIWYQGEANVSRAAQYRELLPALIADWRGSWNLPELSFYYAQIAPFAYGGDSGQAAALREAQLLAMRVPHTGMAVLMDVGEAGDIHPIRKQEVGRRLAAWALARDYGQTQVACQGPIFRSLTVEDGRARLAFDHTGGALSSRGRGAFPVTLAGADRVFHPALARIEGEELVVWSPAVPEPVAVRYGWGAADEGTLYNAAGLPASSFRTDPW